MRKDKIDWHFKAINQLEFDMDINFKASSKLFMLILEKSIQSGNLKVKPDDINKMTSFEIPKEYFKYIHSLMERQLKPIYKELDADGIIVKTAFPSSIKFTKENNYWFVNILYQGLYNDTRP